MRIAAVVTLAVVIAACRAATVGVADDGLTITGDPGHDGGPGQDSGNPADIAAGDAGADAGMTDGGVDAGGPDAGGPLGCYPPETDCTNGIDDDLNGLTDCADPACDGQTCSTGATCTMGYCPPAG